MMTIDKTSNQSHKVPTMLRSYRELRRIPTFEERRKGDTRLWKAY